MDRKKCTKKSNFLATVASEKRIFASKISRVVTQLICISRQKKKRATFHASLSCMKKFIIETMNLDYKANGGLSLPDGTRSGIWIVVVSSHESSELLLASDRLLRRGSFFL